MLSFRLPYIHPRTAPPTNVTLSMYSGFPFIHKIVKWSRRIRALLQRFRPGRNNTVRLVQSGRLLRYPGRKPR